MANKLTIKQEKFVAEYLKSGNASDAYRKVYDAKKMGRSAVAIEASRLLDNPNISVRVRQAQQNIAEKAEISIADWIKEVKRLATVDPRNLSHPDGRPKMLHELDDDTAAAIASVEVGVDGIKYKFWDKNAALEKVGKHLGAYERDNKQQAATHITRIELVPLGGKDEK